MTVLPSNQDDNAEQLRKLAEEVQERDGVPKELPQPRGHRHFAHGSEGTTEAGRTTGKRDPGPRDKGADGRTQ